MVDLVGDYQNGLFFQRIEGRLSKFVRKSGKSFQVWIKPNFRIRVDEVYSILDRKPNIRKIAAMKATNRGTAAERIGEFLFQRVQQVLISRSG